MNHKFKTKIDPQAKILNHLDQRRDGFEKLQRALKLKGYEFAQELRCSPEWLSKVMSGRRPISAELHIRALELMNRRGLSVSSIPELATSLAASVGEPSQAVYGTSVPQSVIVEADIRRKIDEAIRAAGGDVLRLGYLREQIEQHLRPPTHWTTEDIHDEALRQALEDQLRETDSVTPQEKSRSVGKG
ncbi:hypothetical protein [Opitutus sp. ER46]|uniref:hypothetical protein n=1 Tax=Opitutus sp. ER46 TaxID=2161864 RepID=UPI000D30E384|nr:hypothetical protein [Opitutus sp. ER46]PTX95751.1 hypothetical protein DB354_10090 [Opitutus sp. ER46]